MAMNEEKEELLGKQINDERERLSSDRMDISFGELINLYLADELIIRPEYQRLYRWTDTQKTNLIESILLGIPIPPIFVAEDEDGIWELVDGLQRVSTILSFFGKLKRDNSVIEDTFQDDEEAEDEGDSVSNLNGWRLEKGSLIEGLEGFDGETLPKKYLINIKRAVCRVEILRGKNNTSMKYELFKRLNSGGSKLTPQEIRNAIYRGINPVINELMLELSQNESFKTLTNLSVQKKKELYDQELILRFIAFYNRKENINCNTEQFLDKFMESAVKQTDFPVDMYRNIFEEVMNILSSLHDDAIFRNDRNAFVPAWFEGITIGVAENLELYRESKELLKERIDELKQDEDFKRCSGSASNSRSRIKNRLKRVEVIFSATE